MTERQPTLQAFFPTALFIGNPVQLKNRKSMPHNGESPSYPKVASIMSQKEFRKTSLPIPELAGPIPIRDLDEKEPPDETRLQPLIGH